MNPDLLIRCLCAASFGWGICSARGQDKILDTSTAPVVTISATTVSEGETTRETTRDMVLREEAVQQDVLPSITTRTVLPEPKRGQILPSVDTIAGAEIRTFQRYGIEDVLRQGAGLSLVQAGHSGGQTSLFIRGQESNHAVVLLNGRRLPPGLAGLYQLEFLDISNLESVQIVRGASSSLYGSDALAGAIDLQTTDARYVEENTVRSYVEGGSFETLRTGNKVTLRDGKIGLTFDATTHETNNDRPLSDLQNGTLRGNVAVELADGVFFDFLGSVQEGEVGVPGSALGFGFPVAERNENRGLLWSPRFSVVREEWDFAAFYSHTNNELIDTRSPFATDSILDQTGDEFEAVVNFRPSQETTYTLGAGHYEQSFERIPLTPNAFNTPSAFRFGYSSVFAQGSWDLPENFHLLLSGRHDEQDSFASQPTYSAQLSRDFTETNTTVFAKVGTGYKVASGQDFIFLDPALDPGSLSPEESFTREVGMRQTILNERSSAAVTYFQADIDNLIDVDPFTFVDPAIVDTETEGIEVELRVSPQVGVDFYANYTWLDAFVVSGQYFGSFGGSPGDRLIRRPEHSLGAGLILSGDAWKLGAEMNGGYHRPDAPGLVLPDYSVARVFGSLEVNENLELYGRVENVFDETYESTRGFQAAGTGAFIGARVVLGK
jgi:vitamin B12 transporter